MYEIKYIKNGYNFFFVSNGKEGRRKCRNMIFIKVIHVTVKVDFQLFKVDF
jgi:hypothetical protein